MSDTDDLALIIAKKHGWLSFGMCQAIAETVHKAGWERTAPETRTGVENISPPFGPAGTPEDSGIKR
jgi:hypothetical protein